MQITINYKTKNRLIEKLLEQENISLLEKRSMLGKLTFKKKEFADIYFHSGQLDNEVIENIQNTKKIIVNSFTSQNQLLEELKIAKEKIEVIYPAINIEYKNPKEVKKNLCEKLEIDSKKKIIFFTAKNLKSSGVREFIDIVMQLNFKNMIALITGDNKQITNLKFQLSKFDLSDKLILLENYEDIDELFLAADVFILPTHTKNFASNVLKAMYCKCAVFTTANNASKEVIDVFSTMEHPEDRSMQFKIDALLQNKEDMKLIKKQNRKIAKEYTLEKALLKANNIIATL
ncbi:MAG: hypothetical protein C0625_12210 [Arcobacter sp.]|nr:MAG: hypothetical protein C0625_12210 [Arcobacter sp.]